MSGYFFQGKIQREKSIRRKIFLGYFLRFCFKTKRKKPLCSLGFLQASGANVTFRFFAVFHVRNFLYVGFERSSGFTVRMAHVVSRRLTFTANVANLTHINTSAREIRK